MSGKTEAIFRGFVIILVLGLVSVSLFGLRIAYAQAGQVTLKPTDNTFAPSSESSNTTFTGANGLAVENYTLITPYTQFFFVAVTWLKFSLTLVPNGAVIDNVSLQLFAPVPSPSEPINVSAYYCPNNSWLESTLTYSNMPTYNATVIDSVSVYASNQWYNWSVIDAVANALNSSSKAVTIVLNSPTFSNSTIDAYFDSTESFTNGDYSPQLIIHWSSIIPEFPTFIYLPFFMMATLIGVTLYKKKAMLHKRL